MNAFNLDLAAPCPTCLQPIGAECLDWDSDAVERGTPMRGVHTDRAKVAKVMHLLPKIMHLLATVSTEHVMLLSIQRVQRVGLPDHGFARSDYLILVRLLTGEVRQFGVTVDESTLAGKVLYTTYGDRALESIITDCGVRRVLCAAVTSCHCNNKPTLPLALDPEVKR